MAAVDRLKRKKKEERENILFTAVTRELTLFTSKTSKISQVLGFKKLIVIWGWCVFLTGSSVQAMCCRSF